MQFQWDDGNIDKNWLKHRVTVDETESIWDDENRKIAVSRITRGELRFLCVGISNQSRLLSVIFTFRHGNLVRPISVRPANKKEKDFYYGS